MTALLLCYQAGLQTTPKPSFAWLNKSAQANLLTMLKRMFEFVVQSKTKAFIYSAGATETLLRRTFDVIQKYGPMDPVKAKTIRMNRKIDSIGTLHRSTQKATTT
jgi:hypothetical protein